MGAHRFPVSPLAAHINRNLIAALFNFNIACVGEDIDVLGLDNFPDGVRDILILTGDEALSSPDNRDLAPEAMVPLPEFETDIAATQDQEMLGKKIHLHDGGVSHVSERLEAGDIEHGSAAAHVVEYLFRIDEIITHADLARSLEADLPLMDGSILNGLEATLDAFV